MPSIQVPSIQEVFQRRELARGQELRRLGREHRQEAEEIFGPLSLTGDSLPEIERSETEGLQRRC